MQEFKNVLITGISGSGGSYLAEYIVNNHPEVEVHGISRWHSTSSNENLKSIAEKITVHECDLNDFGSVLSVLKKIKPDIIFHLAAYANVRASFITPCSVLSNNIIGTCNLFEAVRLAEIDPTILLASTSEVYGQVDPKNVPIKENTSLRPSNPYAVSKVSQDLLGFTYFRSYGMKIIRTRMFTYLNPRRRDLFATSFTIQAVRIERGLQKVLLHGNLDSTRTLIDVRDAMESYWVATIRCKPGEVYNIGGTTIISVGEFLEILKKHSKVPIPSRVDPKLLRPADVTLQIPCIDKFTQATGWKPKYSFEESVEYMLSYWRSRINGDDKI
ncbi:MAG: GDP-mannose 4,6-dehydratase [Nanoarchaeota archaeon]|nr:GDP-mannose 4,6-dehydratase [Nanoarchaeota archaeon]MCG2718262.1 GDP-mannose 4,6-dehydratase [Nanoarchaeota archaeon]